MITIKTIAVPKEGSKYYGGPSSSSSNSNISADDISGLELLWKKGTGQNSLFPTYSQNITTNESEVAVGHFNVSGEGALFEVGNGTDDENRSNVFTAFSDGRSVSPIFKATKNIDTPLALVTRLQSTTIVNDGDVKSNTFTGNSAKITTVNATTANISTINSNNIINKETIKTKNLTVTGTAHFFELIIDKIKAAGGAALFTPADGFDVDVVESVSGGYKLYWKCEADGKVRQNMWKVNDQAICMSFNQAKLGTSYNVSNKYYWSLVTAVSEYSKPVTLSDGHKYNWITISTSTCDGTVNPEVGDSIAMLGYRGTDDSARQSAIYITAYASFDKGIDAPFIAQYKGIRDFDIEKYRTSWWSLKTNKFVGDFVIESTGENLIDYINSKSSSLSVDLEGIKTKVQQNTTNITAVNSNLDGLKKTVRDNYSTLDQKADSISSTVSSHTQIIEGLDGRVTTNTQNISNIKQTADSINSTVQSINGDYVSKSLLQQTSNSILASVNDTYIKIGDDNITLGGNTTVKGNLTLTQADQGFKLVGPDGVTEIMAKSVGTYNEFKSANASTQNVVKSVNCNGAQSISDGILRFEGGIIIYLGDRKKGDFIKVRFNTFESKVTNGWTGSSFTNSFNISNSFSAKVMNQYNSAVLHNWNTVYAGSEYSYTFDSNTPNARIYVTFKGNTLYSTWVGNYDVMHGGKPMPMPNAYIQLTCTVTLPTAAHMLIGYDGWGVNFGNNKTVYCGKDGFIACYGNNEFKITSEGISHNNMVTTHTIIGSSSSSSPTIYEVQDPVDLVLCKSGYCKIRMPKTPYNGQTIKVLDKSPDETWIDFNGKYVCNADTQYGSRSLNSNWACKGTYPRLFTYLDNTWYEEYMG